jgi:hypothetical protein
MASAPKIEHPASQKSSAVRTFTVRSNDRMIDLVIPEEAGVRCVAEEIFKDQCYQ